MNEKELGGSTAGPRSRVPKALTTLLAEMQGGEQGKATGSLAGLAADRLVESDIEISADVEVDLKTLLQPTQLVVSSPGSSSSITTDYRFGNLAN